MLALVNLDEAGKIKTAATVIISAICIIFLAVVKELNERYKEKIPLGVPLPGEMVVVSYWTHFTFIPFSNNKLRFHIRFITILGHYRNRHIIRSRSFW